MNYPAHCTSSGAAASRRALARGLAIAATLLAIAGGAHAESGSRICGIKSGLTGYENVGFIMKVHKGDGGKCAEAIQAALNKFNEAGGLTNVQSLNRIWRRVRGGKVGPFAGKRGIYSQSFSQETCEYFGWYVSERTDPDLCVGMPRNTLMVYAGNTHEFYRRNQ